MTRAFHFHRQIKMFMQSGTSEASIKVGCAAFLWCKARSQKQEQIIENEGPLGSRYLWFQHLSERMMHRSRHSVFEPQLPLMGGANNVSRAMAVLTN